MLFNIKITLAGLLITIENVLKIINLPNYEVTMKYLRVRILFNH